MLRIRRLDLQAKISLVLAAVILPTSLIVMVFENKLTRPLLVNEMQQLGITSAKNLAAEIVSQRLLSAPNPELAIENYVQGFLYSQPHIMRMDVIARDTVTGAAKTIASSVVEEASESEQSSFPLVETVKSEYREDEKGVGFWEINVPIEHRERGIKIMRRPLGTVHVVVSMELFDKAGQALWKVTAAAAALSVVLLIFVLSYFLKKTIANDRLLRQAESQNMQLSAQLHDAQRQLMNTEKLAVLGQLTASFAHEIGTPLNAIGGHLQLLREDMAAELKPNPQAVSRMTERLDVINGQVGRIERIVKGFLQSTAKPPSQKQLVDLNHLVDQTLGFMAPQVEAIGVDARRELDRSMGPLRIVPVDFEQILMNLINNSLDSIKAKSLDNIREQRRLEVKTALDRVHGKEWAMVTVFDTGEGIRNSDLPNVLKPFFTTKRPGEGTGLGLTICEELAQKYGGMLEIESKEGAWTRVALRIPYQVDA